MSAKKTLSIILPAKNEAAGLKELLSTVKERHPDAEIILVDDGSTDDTASIAGEFCSKVIKHPYSMGNGAAIKSGARNADGDILIFLDADGQHNPDDIALLLENLDRGYDMVVGARHSTTHSTNGRRAANYGFNRIASFMTGFPIQDLTSGFRAAKADKFRQFLYLLPNGFSYPTTITIAFLRSGYTLKYIPTGFKKREGFSKITWRYRLPAWVTMGILF